MNDAGGLRLFILGPQMSLSTLIRANCGDLNPLHVLLSDRRGTFLAGEKVVRWATERSHWGPLGGRRWQEAWGVGTLWDFHGGQVGGGDTAGGCHLVQEPEEVAWSSGNGDGEKQVGLR